MKKNVIALAVAAAMAAPLAAQAEVTVSGGLQAEVVSLSGDNVKEGLYLTDAQEMGTPESGNFGFIAVSASEDLGNGMKAIAKYGFNVTTGSRAKDHYVGWTMTPTTPTGTASTVTLVPASVDSSIGTRDAYVGISGGFGTVLAGRMSSPYKSSTVSWDPFLATSAQARGNYGMSGYHNGYVDNAIAYANKFGGAKVVAAIVIDEADTAPGDASETSGDHAVSFSVNVPVGPVELAVAYIGMTDFGTGDTGDKTGTKVGVKWTSGAIGVAGQYEMLKNGNSDDTNLYVNATYTVGANTFAAAYGMQDNEAADTQPTYIAVGMVHSFSKNTSAHVGYIGLDHDGSSDSGIAAGLRVKF